MESASTSVTLLRVLVACEESGTIRDAFRRRGHHAYSCDLLSSRGDPDNAEFHYQGDIFECLKASGEWDLMIAHPSCQYTTVAGARWLYEKPGRLTLQDKAIRFFIRLDKWSAIQHRCIEHPQSVVSTRYRKYDQLVRPYWFGEKETKQICLYLTNLPPLEPTKMLKPPRGPAKDWSVADKKIRNKVHRAPPGPNRARDRSKTCEGLAEAMAAQYSEYILKLRGRK